jgi:large subunit ribosomal protein L25
VEDKKVIASIPLKFVGNPVGVKDGGKLHIKMKALKVKTFPKYLRENINVNIDNLELNGNVRVEDVQVENYEIMNSPRIPVASVTLTRELKQEEAATTVGTTATHAAGASAAPATGAATTAATPAKK